VIGSNEVIHFEFQTEELTTYDHQHGN